MKEYILVFISAFLVNNFVLVHFLGLCPLIGISKKIETTFFLGIITVLITLIASIFSWSVNYFIVNILKIFYLKIFVCIFSVSITVQFFEIIINKINPILYRKLGIFLPLTTTNCSITGAILLSMKYNYNFLKTIIHGLSVSLGFLLITVIFSSIRERLLYTNIPRPFQGLSIIFITAGIMCISFMGFSGIIKFNV